MRHRYTSPPWQLHWPESVSEPTGGHVKGDGERFGSRYAGHGPSLDVAHGGMAQPRSRGKPKHRQPSMSASLPKSQGHTFAAHAFCGLAGIGLYAVCQECRRQPERAGNPLNGIEAGDALPLLQKQNRLAIEQAGTLGQS